MVRSANHQSLLRRALTLDAAASGAMGLLLIAATPVLQSVLGLPANLLRMAAVILLPFALLLVVLATRAHPPRVVLMGVVGGNAVWVLGSMLLLMSNSVAPTLLGKSFIVAQAAAVALFTWLEYRGLRRDHGANVLGHA